MGEAIKTKENEQHQAIADLAANKFFSQKNGELHVGNCPVSEIAERFGTPLYVYDANVLKALYQSVRDNFDPRVSILFALKANSNAMVAKTLRLAGAGCEVASAGEIEIAKAAGFSGENLQFAGPGKTAVDLERACGFGVYSINAESAGEIERISRIAQQRNKPAGVAIRVQQSSLLQSARMRMSGGDSKFGVPAAEVPALAKLIAGDQNLTFRGLHLYAGTQCFDPDAWIATAQQLLEVAGQVEAETGLQVPHLNFGGGFGVPVFEGDEAFDIESAARQLKELIDADTHPERKYFIELGRYLTASAGLYVARVIDVKTIGETRHVIIDGGMHHHAAAVGMGSIIKRSFPIVLPERLNETSDCEQCLGGPLCLPLDDFGRKIKMPEARVGDLVAILSSGAYGLSFSPVLFLGHALPGEVLVDGDEMKLVRERGKPEDALCGQSVI